MAASAKHGAVRTIANRPVVYLGIAQIAFSPEMDCGTTVLLKSLHAGRVRYVRRVGPTSLLHAATACDSSKWRSVFEADRIDSGNSPWQRSLQPHCAKCRAIGRVPSRCLSRSRLPRVGVHKTDNEVVIRWHPRTSLKYEVDANWAWSNENNDRRTYRLYAARRFDRNPMRWVCGTAPRRRVRRRRQLGCLDRSDRYDLQPVDVRLHH